jgi:hypothetical protein
MSINWLIFDSNLQVKLYQKLKTQNHLGRVWIHIIMNANAMEFIHLNVHPSLVINL